MTYNLDGRSAKIKRGSYYVQSSTDTDNTADNTNLLNHSENVNEAAVWHFEATNNGTYYIFTEDGSNRSYLNLTQNTNNTARAHASMTGNPQEFTIALENGSYVISANVSGTTYYLNQHNGSAGIGGYSARSGNGDNDVFSFEFEPNLATDLANRTFKLHNGSNYLTNSELEEVSGVTQLAAGNADAAASWLFEASGEPGKYFISTVINGEKKYLNMDRVEHESNSYAHGMLGDSPQLYTVEKVGDYYRISTLYVKEGDSRNYYLRYRYMTSQSPVATSNGFSGLILQTEPQYIGNFNMSLDFTNPTITGEESDPEKYMLLVKYAGDYYVVHNDGTLMPVDDPSHVTGQFEIDDPMVWLYDGSNLYHRHVQTGFQGNNLASDFFYRYIDPESDSGLFDENENNTPLNWESDRQSYVIQPRPMKEYTQITYENYHISSQNNPMCYIGVVNDNGQLKIVGNQSEGNAAEIYFTKMLLEDQMVYNDRHHTVNHIDISIEGHATVSAPLAYGTYYYNDGTGVKTLIVTRENPVTLEIAQEVDITMDDVMRANVSAYTINASGEHVPIDNAFHISGFSGNHDTGASKNQTRIEGVFKVADLPEIQSYYDYNGEHVYVGYPNNENGGGFTDNNGVYNNLIRDMDNIKAARLEHKIYYTVSTTKQIDVELKYNNFLLYDNSDDAQRNTGVGVKKGQATVTLGNSFNYWDLRNECPPLAPDFIGYGNLPAGQTRRQWLEGGLVWVEDAGRDDGSGMDFQLGTDDKDKFGILAVEITKFIMDPSGTVITPKTNVTNTFYIYHLNACPEKSTIVNEAAVASVVGMDVNAYHNDNLVLLDNNGAYDYNQYAYNKSKTTVVGVGGTSSIYDYDIPAGMVYIEEDASETSLPRTIEDADGKIWYYKETRIETEYVWRGDQYSGLHVSDNYHLTDEGAAASRYLSHPEVLGGYEADDGSSCYNGFLEFYVYNIYEPEKINIPVRKVWKHENGSLAAGQEGASIDVELGRYKLVDDTENPATGDVTISHSVTGGESGAYQAEYKLMQGNKTVGDEYYETGTLTFHDVPEGIYTLELIESADGYTIDTTIDSLPVASKVISVTTGGTTVVDIDTALTLKVSNLVTLHVINQQATTGTPNNEFDAYYSFPENGTVVFTIYRPSAMFTNSDETSFHVKYNLNGAGFTEVEVPTENATQWTYVYQDVEITLTNAPKQTIIFEHNWDASDCKITGVAIKGGTAGSAPTAAASPSPTPGANATPSSAPVNGSVSYVTYTNGRPESLIPGKIYVDDPEFKEYVTLGNGNWEDTVNGLPAVDDEGYQYVYYIRSAQEHGITAEPNIEPLVSMGETTLEITNTIPNEKPVVTVKKVDENGYPLTGAEFTLTKDGSSKTFTVTNADGTCVLNWDTDGLPSGSYVLTETGSPAGYKTLNGNIAFTVAGNDIVQDSISIGSDNITFDRKNFTITVRNEPDIPNGSLRVIKSWLDINGNVLSNHPASADFKLVQLAQNEGGTHTVTANFYQNNESSPKYTVSANGRGAVTFEWEHHHDYWNYNQDNITVSGIDSSYYVVKWTEKVSTDSNIYHSCLAE